MKEIITLLGVVLLAFGAVMAACDGGDKGLSREEYFERLQTIDNEADRRFEELGPESDVAFDDTVDLASRIEATRAFLDGYAEILGDAIGQVAALNPPSGLKEAHDEFLDAADDFPALIEEARNRAADAESEADVEEVFMLFESAEFEAGDQRFIEACTALENLAADSGITVDLECAGEE